MAQEEAKMAHEHAAQAQEAQEQQQEEEKKDEVMEDEEIKVSDDDSDYSEQSFDADDFEEFHSNKVHWSNIEEANTKGQSRHLFNQALTVDPENHKRAQRQFIDLF